MLRFAVFTVSALDCTIETDALYTACVKLGLDLDKVEIVRCGKPVDAKRLQTADSLLELMSNTKARALEAKTLCPKANFWIGVDLGFIGPNGTPHMIDYVSAQNIYGHWLQTNSNGVNILQINAVESRQQRPAGWSLGQVINLRSPGAPHGSIDDPFAKMTDGAITRLDTLTAAFHALLAQVDRRLLRAAIPNFPDPV